MVSKICSLPNPFPRFDAKNVLMELQQTGSSEILKSFVRIVWGNTIQGGTDQRPLNIVFLGLESQNELESKIDSFCSSYFIKIIIPLQKKYEDLKERLAQSEMDPLKAANEKLKNQLIHDKEIDTHQKRASLSQKLTSKETWTTLREEAAPWLFALVNKGNIFFEKFQSIVKINPKSVSETSEVLKLNEAFDTVENKFRSIASILHYPPCALVHAWTALVDLEKIVGEAEEALSQVKPAVLSKLPTHETFFNRYKKHLSDFKNAIHTEDEKFILAAHKLFEELGDLQDLEHFDPLKTVAHKFTEVGVKSLQFPTWEAQVTKEDITGLMDLLVKRSSLKKECTSSVHDQNLARYLNHMGTASQYKYHLTVGIGPSQEGTVCFPLADANKFSYQCEAGKAWPLYRGPSPFTVWMYNAHCRRYSTSTHQPELLVPIAQMIIQELEDLPYDKKLKSEKAHTHNMLNLMDAWEQLLAKQGLKILHQFKFGEDYLKELQAYPSKTPEGLAWKLPLLSFIRRYAIWFQKSYPKTHPNHAEIDNFINSLAEFDQRISQRFFEACITKNTNELTYWQNLYLTRKDSLTDEDKSHLEQLQKFFIDGYKADLESVCSALEKIEKLPQAQSRERMLRFIETRFYDIDSPAHPLHPALEILDQWFSYAPDETFSKRWKLWYADIARRTLETFLHHFETPELWEQTNLKELHNLSAEVRKQKIPQLVDKFSRTGTVIPSHANWDKLILILNDSNLTFHYLNNLMHSGAFYDCFDSSKFPEKITLIQNTPSILGPLEKEIIARFHQCMLGRGAASLTPHIQVSKLCQMITAFFNPAIQTLIYNSLDQIVLNKIRNFAESGIPQRTYISRQLLQGYHYPLSEEGKTQLEQWLQGYPLLKWHPGIWNLIAYMVATNPTIVPLAHKWRLEWLKKAFEGQLVEPFTEMFQEPLGNETGGDYFKRLFGDKATSAFKLIQSNMSRWGIYYFENPHLRSVWAKITRGSQQAMNPTSESRLQQDIDANLKLLNAFTIRLGVALYEDQASLKPLYQEHFTHLIETGMNSPHELPPEWIYQGLAAIALSTPPKEWETLRSHFLKALFKAVPISQNSSTMLWEQIWITLPPEIQKHKWINRCGDLLGRNNIEAFQQWGHRLQKEYDQFNQSISSSPDWLVLHDEEQGMFFDSHQVLTQIHLLPTTHQRRLLSSLKHKLFSCLTPYSFLACRFLEQLYLMPLTDPQIAKRYELYYKLTCVITNLRKDSFQAEFDTLVELIQNLPKGQSWLHPLSMNEILTLDLQQRQRKQWHSSLQAHMPKRDERDILTSTSFHLGSCRITNDLGKILAGQTAEMSQMGSLLDLDISTLSPSHQGIIFEYLFLSTLCNVFVPEFDIVRLHKNQTQYFIRDKKYPFEALQQARNDLHAFDAYTYGGYFVMELIWGTQFDHPNNYQLVVNAAKAQGSSLFRTRVHVQQEPKRFRQEVNSNSNRNDSSYAFLFCFDAQMRQPLDPSLRDKILNADPWLIIEMLATQWTIAYEQLAKVFDPTLDERMLSQWDSRFGGLAWSEAKIHDFVSRLTYLQKLLKTHPQATLYEILEAFDPIAAWEYAQSNGTTPQARYEFLTKGNGFNLPPNKEVQIIHEAACRWGGVYASPLVKSKEQLSISELMATIGQGQKEERYLANPWGAETQTNSQFFLTLQHEMLLHSLQEAKQFFKEQVEGKIIRGEWKNTPTKKTREVFCDPEIHWDRLFLVDYFTDLSALKGFSAPALANVTVIYLTGLEMATETLSVIAAKAQKVQTLVLDDSTLSVERAPAQRPSVVPLGQLHDGSALQKARSDTLYFPNLQILQAQRLRNSDGKYLPLLFWQIVSPKLVQVALQKTYHFQRFACSSAVGECQLLAHQTWMSLVPPHLIDKKDNKTEIAWKTWVWSKPLTAPEIQTLFEEVIVKDNGPQFANLLQDYTNNPLSPSLHSLAKSAIDEGAVECLTVIFDAQQNLPGFILRFFLLHATLKSKHPALISFVKDKIQGAFKTLSKEQKAAHLNHADARGVTPLHLAALGGHGELVDWLIEEGASLELLDDRGRNCLSRAVSQGSTHVIERLLETAAQAKMLYQAIQLKNNPFERALVHHQWAVLPILFEKAAPHHVPGQGDFWLLAAAMVLGEQARFKYLVEDKGLSCTQEDTRSGLNLAILATAMGVLDQYLNRDKSYSVHFAELIKGSALLLKGVANYFGQHMTYYSLPDWEQKSCDAQHLNAMHYAILGKQYQTLEFQVRAHLQRPSTILDPLEEAIDPLLEDQQGENAFDLAQRLGDQQAVNILLKHSAIQHYFNGLIFYNHLKTHPQATVESIKGLFDKGILINASYGPDKKSLLQVALELGNLDAAHFLIDNGANPSQSLKGVPHKQTLLHFSARQRGPQWLEFAQYLVSKGLALTDLDGDQKTPLHYSIAALNTEFSCWALKSTPDKLMHVWDSQQNSPLHLLCSSPVSEDSIKGTTLILKAALVDGTLAGVHTKNRAGDTPLHITARLGHTGLAKILLDSGASVDPVNEAGETPLQIASGKGNRELVNLLLTKMADPTKFNAKHANWQAIHYAVAQGSKEIVGDLLNASSFTKISTQELYRIAVDHKQWGVIQLLIERHLASRHDLGHAAKTGNWKVWAQLKNGINLTNNPAGSPIGVDANIAANIPTTSNPKLLIQQMKKQAAAAHHQASQDYRIDLLHHAAMGGNVDIFNDVMNLCMDKVKDFLASKDSKTGKNLLETANDYKHISMIKSIQGTCSKYGIKLEVVPVVQSLPVEEEAVSKEKPLAVIPKRRKILCSAEQSLALLTKILAPLRKIPAKHSPLSVKLNGSEYAIRLVKQGQFAGFHALIGTKSQSDQYECPAANVEMDMSLMKDSWNPAVFPHLHQAFLLFLQELCHQATRGLTDDYDKDLISCLPIADFKDFLKGLEGVWQEQQRLIGVMGDAFRARKPYTHEYNQFFIQSKHLQGKGNIFVDPFLIRLKEWLETSGLRIDQLCQDKVSSYYLLEFIKLEKQFVARMNSHKDEIYKSFETYLIKLKKPDYQWGLHDFNILTSFYGIPFTFIKYSDLSQTIPQGHRIILLSKDGRLSICERLSSPALDLDRVKVIKTIAYAGNALRVRETRGDGFCAIHALLGSPSSKGDIAWPGRREDIASLMQRELAILIKNAPEERKNSVLWQSFKAFTEGLLQTVNSTNPQSEYDPKILALLQSEYPKLASCHKEIVELEKLAQENTDLLDDKYIKIIEIILVKHLETTFLDNYYFLCDHELQLVAYLKGKQLLILNEHIIKNTKQTPEKIAPNTVVIWHEGMHFSRCEVQP